MKVRHFCATATLFIMAASMAEDRTFDQGKLNIVCSCVTKTLEQLRWGHVVDVPKNGLSIDLNQVCATTRDSYPDARSLCKETFRAIAYSFTSAK